MSKFVIFPPKNLEKIRALKIRMRRFLVFLSQITVSNSMSIFIFPAKKLRKKKYGRQKYACAVFIFFDVNISTYYVLI